MYVGIVIINAVEQVNEGVSSDGVSNGMCVSSQITWYLYMSIGTLFNCLTYVIVSLTLFYYFFVLLYCVVYNEHDVDKYM